MELQLQQFIQNVELVTNIHQQNEAHVLVRLSTGTTSSLFCVGYHCPRYTLLPNEAVWLDMNPESQTYRYAFLRTKRDHSNPYNDEWTQLYFYTDAFPTQNYDPSDLSQVSIAMPNPATVTVAGIGLLSAQQLDSIVVVEGDSRLTDDRYPTAHTHPETPATIIQSGSVVTTIADQTAPEVGYTLIKRNGAYVWDRVKEADLS
jgi:hypothetical protein